MYQLSSYIFKRYFCERQSSQSLVSRGFHLVVGLFSNKIIVMLPREFALIPPKETSWKRGLPNALAVRKSSFEVHDLLDTRKFS